MSTGPSEPRLAGVSQYSVQVGQARLACEAKNTGDKNATATSRAKGRGTRGDWQSNRGAKMMQHKLRLHEWRRCQ